MSMIDADGCLLSVSLDGHDDKPCTQCKHDDPGRGSYFECRATGLLH